MNKKGSALDNMSNMKAIHRRSNKLLSTLGHMYKFTCLQIHLFVDSAARETPLWSKQDIISVQKSMTFGPKPKIFASIWGNYQMEEIYIRISKFLSNNTARDELISTSEKCLSFSCQSALSTISTGIQLNPFTKDTSCQVSPPTRQPILVDVAVQTEAAGQLGTGAGDVSKATKDIPNHFKRNHGSDVVGRKENPSLQIQSHMSADPMIYFEDGEFDISDEEELPRAFFKSAGEQDSHQERNTVSLADELTLAMDC